MSNLMTQKHNGSKTSLPETRTLFDRLFDDPFFRWPIASALASNAREFMQPEMDLYEKDGHYIVELAVPGMKIDSPFPGLGSKRKKMRNRAIIIVR